MNLGMAKNRCKCKKCGRCIAEKRDQESIGRNMFNVPRDQREQAKKDYIAFMEDFHKRGEYSKEDYAEKRRLEALLR
jgi:hypothetical protein